MLELKSVVVGYEDREILRVETFVCQPGQWHVFRGHNGSGKSTFLSSIIGLTPLKAGQIYFLGQDRTQQSAAQRVRAGMRYVSQASPAFSHWTVAQHVAVAEVTPDKQTWPEIFTWWNTPYNQLSGGQQQLVRLVLCLAQNAPLYVLDEPLGQLSKAWQQRILRTIHARQQQGSAVLMAEQMEFTPPGEVTRWNIHHGELARG